jgi:hypothetical protein
MRVPIFSAHPRKDLSENFDSLLNRVSPVHVRLNTVVVMKALVMRDRWFGAKNFTVDRLLNLPDQSVIQRTVLTPILGEPTIHIFRSVLIIFFTDVWYHVRQGAPTIACAGIAVEIQGHLTVPAAASYKILLFLMLGPMPLKELRPHHYVLFNEENELRTGLVTTL